MKEIEIKLKYNDEKAFRDKLKTLKAKVTQTYEIIDCYYAKEGENMKNAQNLLRVRTKKEESELTFKGKRETESDVWERVEINVPIQKPENMGRILNEIGFKLIRKNRTVREYFLLKNTEIVIVKIIEPAKINFVEIEGKTAESVGKVAGLFKGVLEPIGDDYFSAMDNL